jgi:hypothetical protein
VDAIIEATIVDGRDIIPSLIFEAVEAEFCNDGVISSDCDGILTIECRVEHATPAPRHILLDSLVSPDLNDTYFLVWGTRNKLYHGKLVKA